MRQRQGRQGERDDRRRWAKVSVIAEILNEQAADLHARLGFLAPEIDELLVTTEILVEAVMAEPPSKVA